LRPSFLTKAAPELASRRWTTPQWADSTVLGAGTFVSGDCGLTGGSGVTCPVGRDLLGRD
jgi:hypothetical protein